MINVRINGEQIEQVESFKCSGVTIQSKGSMDAEIQYNEGVPLT